MKKDDVFDAILEGDAVPELPREQLGRTLPFTPARAPLEEIYRLSQDAEKPAELILKAARAGADELAATLRSLEGKPYRGFALLYAAQKGTALVAEDPRKALALAVAIEQEAASLPDADSTSRSSTPAPRQATLAEALLVKAQAHTQEGDTPKARSALARARSLFREAADLGFGAAMCDFHEGQIASFERDFDAAQRLLRSAAAIFAEFGQLHYTARAEAAIGLAFMNQGEALEAITHLDNAIAAFDPEMDCRPLASALNNKASTLVQLGRFDEARATYARALNLALRNGLDSLLRYVRTGLAELDFHRHQYVRALRAFREVAHEAAANGSSTDVLFARLYVAECLARTGQLDAMAVEIEALRRDRKQTVFSPSPALGELFVCLDQGTIDADLVAHVREYLQDEENGIERAYQPLRLVG